jgi:predicted nucleotidyltransferase
MPTPQQSMAGPMLWESPLCNVGVTDRRGELRRILGHNEDMTRKIRSDGRAIDVSARLPALEETLSEVPGLAAVYLYGSYGTPSQTPLSDIDIALVFKEGREPSPQQHLELIGRIIAALQEDDVSVTVLNQAPLALRFKVLAEGRRLLLLDEIAHADVLEHTITQYSDFAIDEERFLREYDRALVEDYCRGAG